MDRNLPDNPYVFDNQEDVDILFRSHCRKQTQTPEERKRCDTCKDNFTCLTEGEREKQMKEGYYEL